jgi:cysteine desulfurase / selenocysteine lyase
MNLDIERIRKEFPILDQEINGKKLVYLDNAATTQKPKVVIDAISNYYSGYNANIHRGIHHLAEKATAAFEKSRNAIKEFINAESTDEVVFTYGTTDGINLIAQTYGRKFLKAGDEIIISTMEHHSNIVPWQMLCEENGCKLKVIPIFDNGELDIEAYKNLLTEKTKIVSVVYASNALGTINPIQEIIKEAHKVGAIMIVDAAQAVSHITIDVQALEVDFLCFSAHKLYGPTGMGALYGKRELLDKMPPWRGGGEMIKEVTFEKTTYNELPYKFEAGTPNIADVIGITAAIDYVNNLGRENIARYENELLKYATEAMIQIPGLKVIGNAENKVSVLSFIIDGIHPQDIGVLLDQQAIAIRTGHHCTQPLMKRFGIDGTSRASFAVYNTKEEIDWLVEGITKVKRLLT